MNNLNKEALINKIIEAIQDVKGEDIGCSWIMYPW